MNYGDIIEYTEYSLDPNMEEAKVWCKNNNATLDELVERRDLPKRYFQINKIPEPIIPEPTEDEKKERVRIARNALLLQTDFTQLADAPFTAEEKQSYAQYRQYLRDYTNLPSWWENYPLTYEEWRTTFAQEL